MDDTGSINVQNFNWREEGKISLVTLLSPNNGFYANCRADDIVAVIKTGVVFDCFFPIVDVNSNPEEIILVFMAIQLFFIYNFIALMFGLKNLNDRFSIPKERA